MGINESIIFSYWLSEKKNGIATPGARITYFESVYHHVLNRTPVWIGFRRFLSQIILC